MPFSLLSTYNSGLGSGGVDVGLQKQILHDRYNITFTGVNILNTMIYRIHLNYGVFFKVPEIEIRIDFLEDHYLKFQL